MSNIERLFLNADLRKSNADKRKFYYLDNLRPSACDSREYALKDIFSARNKIAFFDVDTQFDFINTRGKLFIDGAPKIIGNLIKLTSFAKKKRITILSSLDTHIKNDPEFKVFPAHCLERTLGQKKIKGTQLKNVVFVEMKNLKKDKILSLLNRFKQIIIRKNTYTVFANPNTKKLIGEFDTFYVYGVALDYCVRACCLGLRKYKKNVYLITDSTKEVDPKSKLKVINELKIRGVRFIKTKDILMTIK